MNTIPLSLAPFFQEYDLATMDIQQDSHTIIERALQFGNKMEIHWLFTTYHQEQIIHWVRKYGEDKLPQPHRVFWKTVLDIS